MRIDKLQNLEWVPIGDADNTVGTIQAIGSTWIKNLRVTINGRETFNSNSLYAYKSYIDLELSYNREVKSTYLGVMGYWPLSMTQFNQNAPTNDQLVASKRAFAQGNAVQFFTKLNADVFSSELLMINNVAIELELHPHNSKFCLHDPQKTNTSPAYRMVLSSCKLYCKYVELMESLALDIDRHLQEHPARYGIRKSELKSHYISADRMEFQVMMPS
jgi:hypothetical protein